MNIKPVILSLGHKDGAGWKEESTNQIAVCLQKLGVARQKMQRWLGCPTTRAHEYHEGNCLIHNDKTINY